MRKINLSEIPESEVWSPKKTMGGWGHDVSIALGRKPDSTDLVERHPFDLEIQRYPVGKPGYPYHAHSAQWELYYVLSGRGIVRHESGTTEVVQGDAFIFKPGEAHQLGGSDTEELVVMCIADNPVGESCYYPDSNKWLVRSPERRLMRSEPLDYFDGEE